MQKRRAVVVGIEDYRATEPAVTCGNDAAAVADIADRLHGFDVELLVNAEATRTNVHRALRAALTEVSERDRVLFYYSGYGHRAAVDGQIRECLALYPEPGSESPDWLFDDVLIELAADLPEGCLTVILDTGFSSAPGHANSKAWSHGEVDASQPVRVRDFAGRNATSTTVNGLVITACDDTGVAMASTSVTDGLSVFTYCLLDTLDHLRTVAEHINQISNRDIKRYTTKMVKDVYAPQRPQWRFPRQAGALAQRSFLLLESTSRLPDHRSAAVRGRRWSPVAAAPFPFGSVMQWDEASALRPESR